MKTEKEKMLTGEPYKANAPELLAERQKAKELIFSFNNLPPSEVDKRKEILQQLLGKTGDSYYFEPPFRCDYGYNIEIGENFYSNYNLTILDCATVIIGDHVLIGPNVGIFTAGHPMHYENRIQEW